MSETAIDFCKEETQAAKMVRSIFRPLKLSVY